MLFIVSYVATGVVFLAIDAVWLKLTVSRLYRPLMGGLAADEVSVLPAILFYALYVAGIVTFAVQPALTSGRWTTAAALGAFLGLVAYGTYDLTNQATVRHWPAVLTVVDLAWGTLLTGISATAGALITRAVLGAGSA